MTHQTCRRHSFPLGGGIALCALLSLCGAAYAQTDILSAAANSSLTTITIKGTGLQPTSGKPTVSLGSYTLSIGNFNNVQIIAALPPNLKSGTYNLEVTDRRRMPCARFGRRFRAVGTRSWMPI